MKKITLLLFTLLLGSISYAQCEFTSQWPFSDQTVSNAGDVGVLSTCVFFGDYTGAINFVLGDEYLFDGDGGYITLRDNADSSVVLAQGDSPLNWVATVTGVQAHWALDATCDEDSSCHVVSVQNLDGTPPPAPTNVDCASATTLVCGDTINTTSVGSTGTKEDIGCTIGSNGIWFTFEGTGADMTINSTASFDHKLGIASGDCGSLVNMTCRDSSSGAETYTFASVLDETYHVYIANWSGTGTTTGSIGVTLTCAIIPACTPTVVDSSTVVDDCNNSQFSVEVVVSAVEDGSFITDGLGGSFPIVAGTVTAGPYNDGDTVTLTVEHSDTDCNYSLGNFEIGCTGPGEACETAIVVGALPYTTTDNTVNYGNNYTGAPGGCGTTSNYLSGDDVVYAYTATSDTEINVSMIPTAAWTGIFVYTDCADIGTACIAGLGNSNTSERNFDLLVDNGTTYYFVISIWPTPNNFGYTFNLTENTCTAATVDYSVVNDCDVSGGFYIDVNVTDMGTATDLTVSDDQGNVSQAVTGVGTVQFGPYVNATDVVITTEDDNDANCILTSSAITQAVCPPTNIDCASATTLACGDTINTTSVGSTGTKEDIGCTIGSNGIWFTFEGTGGDMTINSTTSFDHRLAIASGDCGSLVNMICQDSSVSAEVYTFASVLDETYYVYIAHWSGTSTTTGSIDVTLTCAIIPACTPTVVDSSTVVDDCDNSQFSVDVVVSAVEDGSFITDGLGGSFPIVAGTVTAGPYNDGDVVTLTVEHSDTDCNYSLGDFETGCRIAGSLCENPIVVGTLPYNTTDDTSIYGNDYSNGSSSCSSWYMSGNDVVYSFTPDNDGSFNVLLSNLSDTYSGIHVLDDCPGNAPNCVGFEGNGNSNDREFDVTLVGGTTYYIVISTWASPNSTAYTLDITENTCTVATVDYSVVNDCDVSGGFYIDVNVTDMGSATDLTISDDQGNVSQAVTAAGTVQFGPYVNATDVVITTEDDNDATCTLTSSAITQAACPPANETCATATTIVCGDSISGTSVGSTGTQEGGVCTMGANGVWYTFTGDGGDITVTVSASFDHELAITSGTCGALVNVACRDQSTGEESYTVSESTLGETYYVYIANWSGSSTTTGTHTISLTCETMSIDEFDSPEAFKYFPNPVTNVLNVRAQNNISGLAVYNMLGQEVLRAAPNTVNGEVDMSSLQTGAYFVKVTIGNTTKTIRVIKN